MADLLLTGATGRLGNALIPALYSYGYSVRALVRPGGKSTPALAERVECDLSREAPPKEIFDGITRVVHLAALVGDHPPSELMRNNAFATKNLLSACPLSVGKIVMASSISIYGDLPGKLINEYTAPKPKGAYGQSKLMAENYAREHSHEFAIFALRFGMIYGPGFTEGYYSVFGKLQKGRMALLGEGSNRIPLVHIDDAIRAVLLCLESKHRGFRAYNIVGETSTQKEIVKIAAEALSVPIPKSKIPAQVAIMGAAAKSALAKAGVGSHPTLSQDHIRQLSSDRIYSTLRAKEELGFMARVKLRDGIKQMAEIYLSEQSQKERLKNAQAGILTPPASG